MSYQVLARKWRPKNFAQLMGQEHVVSVLANALDQGRLHHAYLFTGTRGVGKTTIARIFAKSLNCQQGITKTPCGQCDVCQDIDDGRFVDLLEIDAASKTKVDDTREILDNVQYAPSRGRFKVYLIDEVHMLSRSSFNALLKTLEEPPPHVKFILATTDPQKLPVTVLSRCLQFHLKALTRDQIATKLDEILTAEHVEFEASALSLLAKAARGSMRDSLSLTDQAIAQGQGHIKLANIQAMLGSIDHQWCYKLVIALLKKDSQGLMTLSKQIASFAPSYHRLLAELIQLFHQIALWQLVPEATDVDPEQSKYLSHFANAMSPEQVQLYYQIALQGRKDLPYSGDEQAGFDMILLRLMAFAPANDASQLRKTEGHDSASAAVAALADIDQEVELTPKAELGVNQAELTPEPMPEQALEIAPGIAPVAQPEATNVAAQTVAPQEEDEELSTYHQVSHLMTDMFGEENQQAATQPEQKVGESGAQAPVIEETSLDLEQQSLEAQAFGEGIPGATPVVSPDLEVTVATPAAVKPAEHVAEPLRQPTTPEAAVVDDSVQQSLIQRNMLRSHRKQLEGGGKKSDSGAGKSADNKPAKSGNETIKESPLAAFKNKQKQPAHVATAEKGQQHEVAANQSQTQEAPSKEPVEKADPPLPEVQPGDFDPNQTDPAVIRKAMQVDMWSYMIDAMELTGRLRQLAQNSEFAINEQTNQCQLTVTQKVGHLSSGSALESLTRSLTLYYQKPIELVLNWVENLTNSPQIIQQKIDQYRHQSAVNIITQDQHISQLQNGFAAELDNESIAAL